jgi:hypothetical protein
MTISVLALWWEPMIRYYVIFKLRDVRLRKNFMVKPRTVISIRTELASIRGAKLPTF